MSKQRPAFGGMLVNLVELGAIEFQPEPLDAIVERRLKAIWTTRSCPTCGADTLHTRRISTNLVWPLWLENYLRGEHRSTIRNPPGASSESSPSSTLIRFSASTRSPSFCLPDCLGDPLPDSRWADPSR